MRRRRKDERAINIGRDCVPGSFRENHKKEVTPEKGFGGCVGVFQANLEDIIFGNRKQNMQGQGGWKMLGQWLVCCLGVVVAEGGEA